MESIKRKLIIYALLFIISIFLSMRFLIIQKIEMSIFYGVTATIVLIFLYRQSRILYYANLIYNNQILIVPSSIVNTKNHDNPKYMVETVVSTFGLLLKNNVYKWGCDGINGVRLNMVQMDRDHIWLTFGANNDKIRIELLHGMTDGNRIFEITRKIWHETGVQVELSGFQQHMKGSGT